MIVTVSKRNKTNWIHIWSKHISNAASKTLNCHRAWTTMDSIRTCVLNDWDFKTISNFRTTLQFQEFQDCWDPCNMYKQLSKALHRLVAWHSGNTLCRINEVTLRWAWLVLGCVTVYGQVKHLSTESASWANSAFYPPWTEYQLSGWVVINGDGECCHHSCLYVDLLAQADRRGPKVGGHLALRATFIRWTGWTLAVAVHCYDVSTINIVVAVTITILQYY